MSRQADEFMAPVVETFRQSGLDPARTIIHGGAVLALHGLRSAGDIDVLVSPADYSRMAAANQTPSGLLVDEVATIAGRKCLVSLIEPAEGLLPIDISTFGGFGGRSRFNHHWRLAEEHDSAIGRLRFSPLGQILSQKSPPVREKDSEDIRMISAYFDRRATGTAY